MSRELGESTIDGKKYQASHWPVDKATKMLAKLIKILGEPLAMVIMGASENKPEGGSVLDVSMNDVNMDAIGTAIKGLASRLDEDEVVKIFRDCLESGVLCEGKKFDYNTHFMGRIGHMMRVMIFVLKHQYQDFLADGLDQ
jgi:hypothetical protein